MLEHLPRQSPVKVGVRSGDTVQITSGVKQGENVIVSGALGLDDKAHILTGKGSAEEDAKEKGDGEKEDNAR